MSSIHKSKLPRLPREFYQGHAMVLWTHTFESRATGWLNGDFHALFRDILLHTCHRHGLITPCYVLMPDHWHIVWMGLTSNSDQWLATAFVRKHLQPSLGAARLQDRAHDHVLRENERARGAFLAACSYVHHNPERAGLSKDWRAWPYLGALVPGYPDLDLRREDFWETFWKVYNRLMAGPTIPALIRLRQGAPGKDGAPGNQGFGGQARRATSTCSPLREERDYSPRPADRSPG